MSFIRKIKKKSGTYLAEVESYRKDGKVKQRLIRYIGKEGSLQAGVTTAVKEHDNVVNKDRVTTEPKDLITISQAELRTTLEAEVKRRLMPYLGKEAIVLPADLLARIENIKDVKSGKKTVSQWAIPYLIFHAEGKHHGVSRKGTTY